MRMLAGTVAEMDNELTWIQIEGPAGPAEPDYVATARRLHDALIEATLDAPSEPLSDEWIEVALDEATLAAIEAMTEIERD